MNIHQLIITPLSRETIARLVITALCLIVSFCTPVCAQNVGDFIVRERIATTGREVNRTWPKGASTIWGTDSSSLPQRITIGSGLLLNSGTLSVTGLTINAVSGLQASLDAKLAASTAATTYVSLTGSYTNPDWLVSIPFSKITARPSTLTGYGITEFATEAFLLTPAEDSLEIGDEGLGWVDGRLTLQTDAGSLQWYQDGGQNIMAWSDRLQADSLDISAVSIFTDAPGTGTSTGEAGQMAFDEFYFYLCVALNHWKRAALVDF